MSADLVTFVLTVLVQFIVVSWLRRLGKSQHRLSCSYVSVDRRLTALTVVVSDNTSRIEELIEQDRKTIESKFAPLEKTAQNILDTLNEALKHTRRI